MTLLAPLSRLRTAHLAACLLATLATGANAQIQLSHTEDASPIPAGMLRLRVTTGWTRFDQRFGTSGLTSLGDELSADPLGARQLPLLLPVEASLQALANDGTVRLSLGRLVTRGDTRIVTTPITMEYGLTRRLSVGVTVPVVQARRVVTVDVNARSGAPANVGLVPAGLRDAAGTQNEAAAASYASASAQLAQRIAACQASPGSAGCGAITGDLAGASAAKALADRFATAARALGTTSATALLAPRANGFFAIEIEQQRAVLNQQLQRFLGAGTAAVSAVYFAPTDFSYVDLQGRDGSVGLLQSALGGGLDSIRTTERYGIGDVSVGAQLLVFDRFQHDGLAPRGLQTRLAVGGAFRFATGRPDSVQNLVDIGTGEGAAVEVHSAFDAIRGRLGGTVAARLLKPFSRTAYGPLFGDPDAGFLIPVFGQRTVAPGAVLGLDLTPRYLLSETLALSGVYGLERIGATTYPGVDVRVAPDYCAVISCETPAGTARTSQRVGLGLRYSTVDAYARGTARYPFEASFTHLTTVRGDAGAPKLSRDQIQVRLYYRLFGR